jgi:hypothetical protein
MLHDVINAPMIRCGMNLKARDTHISCILVFMFSHVRLTLCHLISRFHFVNVSHICPIIMVF